MTQEELAELIADLIAGNVQPRRVVVSGTGLTADPQRARVGYGVAPTLCFIRNDGWTLGTPLVWVQTAFGLWRDQWVAAVPLQAGPPNMISPNW